MQIDWFTLIAEIVNFLVLVALLKYFLYDRIIGIADEREQKIAARFEEAEQKQQEAEKTIKAQHAKKQELEEQQQEILTQARQDAEQQHKELVEQARQEFEATRQQWYASLEQEKAEFQKELRHRTGEQTIRLARQTLAELADTALEHQVVAAFTEKIRQLDQEQQQRISQTLADSAATIHIASSFELPSKQRQHILDALQHQFGDNFQSDFQTTEDLICGLELRANGYKIAWNVETYLNSLEETVLQTINQKISQSQKDNQ